MFWAHLQNKQNKKLRLYNTNKPRALINVEVRWRDLYARKSCALGTSRPTMQTRILSTEPARATKHNPCQAECVNAGETFTATIPSANLGSEPWGSFLYLGETVQGYKVQLIHTLRLPGLGTRLSMRRTRVPTGRSHQPAPPALHTGPRLRNMPSYLQTEQES